MDELQRYQPLRKVSETAEGFLLCVYGSKSDCEACPYYFNDSGQPDEGRKNCSKALFADVAFYLDSYVGKDEKIK